MIMPLTQEQRVTHLLNRITFGATPVKVENVKGLGFFPYTDFFL